MMRRRKPRYGTAISIAKMYGDDGLLKFLRGMFWTTRRHLDRIVLLPACKRVAGAEQRRLTMMRQARIKGRPGWRHAG